MSFPADEGPNEANPFKVPQVSAGVREVADWCGAPVSVDATFVAGVVAQISVNVLLDGRVILSTGPQVTFGTSYQSTFSCREGKQHTCMLTVGSGRLRGRQYELRIDDVCHAAGELRPRLTRAQRRRIFAAGSICLLACGGIAAFIIHLILQMRRQRQQRGR